MGALRSVIVVAALLLTNAPARAGDLDRWRPLMADASARFHVPVEWIERVIDTESRGHTMLDGRPITSRAGAMGLMQLMPLTWAAMRSRLGLGGDPHDPRDNILAGTFYMRLMYERFGYPGLFGAYNAGPARYADFLAGHRQLPVETRAYLERTTQAGPVGKIRSGDQGRGRATLFFVARDPAVPEVRFASHSGVFVIRSETSEP